jgi:hypothetical protein
LGNNMRTKIELNDFIREKRKSISQEEPLSKIRVIDLGTVLAAPYAAVLFGDYGAEVIKIENPDIPDATWGWGIIKEVGIAPFLVGCGPQQVSDHSKPKIRGW